MAKAKPVFGLDKCMACRLCISSCPFSCLDESLTGIDKYNKVYPKMIKMNDCTGCGICDKACPVDAISMKDTVK